MSIPRPDKEIDYKKEIGNPKLVCVMGGPCSGKKQNSELMAEDFGYTYISTGDLLR